MKHSPTIRNMIFFDAALLVLTGVFFVLQRSCGGGWLLPVYVTLLTVTYHFVMRIVVGQAVTVRYRNRKFDLDSPGFRSHKFEPRLYEILRVRRWKGRLITAKPEQFDVRHLSAEALLHNMAQAELVHRIIMPLSFVPLLLIIPYGAAPVFVITSIAACLIDLAFVIIQRYNRPRVMGYLRRSHCHEQQKITCP